MSGREWAGAGSRGGFVLPLTLLCLLTLALSVAALLALTRMEQIGRAAHVAALRAEGEAERNAVMAFASPSPAWLSGIPPGSTRVLVPGRRAIRRLSPTLFLSLGQGTGVRGVHRTRGLVFRYRAPPVGLQRALTSPGVVRVAPGAVITEPSAGPLPCDVADWTASGWLPQAGYTGPLEDPVPWAGRASIVLAPGSIVQPGPRVSSGRCVSADPSNWGEPAGGACGFRRPVIHGPGDVTVTGGVGQGILVVDGDLRLRGGFRFDGMILVGGRLDIAGAGARIRGAVQVLDGGGAGSDIGSGGSLAYSTCRVEGTTRLYGQVETIGAGRWLSGY